MVQKERMADIRSFFMERQDWAERAVRRTFVRLERPLGMKSCRLV